MFPFATAFYRLGPRAMARLLLLTNLWLASCGGSGGSSSNDPVDPPAPPPPQVAVSGSIWYMDSYAKGSFIAPIDASTPPRQLTVDTDPTPWPDGSQYTEYSLGADGKTDTLRVLATSDNSMLHQVALPSFSGDDLRPSPINRTTLLTKYYASVVDEVGQLLVLDVASGQLIHSETAHVKTHKFRWLPDGRLLRLDTLSGEVAVGSVSGSWQVTGHVAIPAGQEVRKIEINPQGTQMALVMRDIDGSKSDAWVAQIDGSQLERITADTATSLIYWSPDGQRLLFDYDDSSCQGNICQGTCLLWYAPANARNLTGLYDSTRQQSLATLVRMRSTAGSLSPLITCTAVHGWLP